MPIVAVNKAIPMEERDYELLKKENEALKEELEQLKKTVASSSFRDRYAVKIIDSLPDMLTVFDMDEVCIDVVSNESTNHVGPSVSELRGTKMWEVLPSEAYLNIHNNMERVKATHKSSVAFHELDVNGVHHYYENRICPLDDNYLLVMCRDISDRVAIQRNMAMLKHALDNVSDAVLGVKADGTLIYVNKQMRKEVLGDTPLGQDISQHPLLWTKQPFSERIANILAHKEGVTYRTNYRVIGDEQIHHQQVTAFKISNYGEESFWFFAKDITDMIKNRDELREFNQLLHGILDNIPLYLFVKDTGDEMRYLYWNNAFVKLSGVSAEEIVGKNDFEIFQHKDMAERYYADDMMVLKTGEPLQRQESYSDLRGDTHILHTLKTLVTLTDRAPLLIGIGWDVTDMQNVEKELVRARIKAEQSDRLKSAFLANMSHEIRTPLNAIVGFSSLIAQADNEIDREHFAEIIKRNSDILLRLISDILDLAKIETGTLDYIKKPMNINEMCKNLYDIHRQQMKSGVTLVLDIPKQPVTIEGDRNRLAQVFTNLVNNAAKFTPKGEIRFGFTVEGNVLHGFCKDTGIGIPKEKQEKIFERFIKLDVFAQGTGLGLSICKMIVEKIGGMITVESEVGKGSIFRFTVPIN